MPSYLCHPRTSWVVLKLVKTGNFKVGESYWKGHSFLIHYGCFFFPPLKIKTRGKKIAAKTPQKQKQIAKT